MRVKDGPKTSPNNNSMGVSAEVSKFQVVWGEKKQNCDVLLWRRNNLVGMSALKKVH